MKKVTYFYLEIRIHPKNFNSFSNSDLNSLISTLGYPQSNPPSRLATRTSGFAQLAWQARNNEHTH
jgi:hypothetical protein